MMGLLLLAPRRVHDALAAELTEERHIAGDMSHGRATAMFELPEFITLAWQINETLADKTISRGSLGNSPHKFVWYNRTPEEFAELAAGKTVGQARAQGKWLFIPLDPGYLLLCGECGGRLLYHAPGTKLPEKYHLWLP